MRLFKFEAAHYDGWEHLVPLRRNVLVGDLNVTLLAGHKWRRGREEQALLIAKNNLVKWIVKLTVISILMNFFCRRRFPPCRKRRLLPGSENLPRGSSSVQENEFAEHRLGPLG